jgi:hypothetical protein
MLSFLKVFQIKRRLIPVSGVMAMDAATATMGAASK